METPRAPCVVITLMMVMIAMAECGATSNAKRSLTPDAEPEPSKPAPRLAGCDELYRVAVVIAESAKGGRTVCQWLRGGPDGNADGSYEDWRPVCELDKEGMNRLDVWELYDSVDWQACGALTNGMAKPLAEFRDSDHLSERPFSHLNAFAAMPDPMYFHIRSTTVYAWSSDFYKVMNALLDRRVGAFVETVKENGKGVLGDASDLDGRCDQMIQSAVVYTAGLSSAISALRQISKKTPKVYRAGNGRSELEMVRSLAPRGGGPGPVFEWRGFMSTAEKGFVWAGTVKWIINDKVGAGADLSPFKYYNSQEREYLLHPYTRLRIDRTEEKGHALYVYADTTLDQLASDGKYGNGDEMNAPEP